MTQSELYDCSLTIQPLNNDNNQNVDPIAQMDKLLQEISSLKLQIRDQRDEINRKNHELKIKEREIDRYKKKHGAILMNTEDETESEYSFDDVVELWRKEQEKNRELAAKYNELVAQSDAQLDSPNSSSSQS